MDKLLQSIVKITDTINEGVGKSAAWLTTILVVLICYDVMMRYLFSASEVWISELEWHLFALIFLLGAGFALKHDKHVRVDLFYANFSAKRKAWVNLIGTLLFLIPWCVLIIMAASTYAHNAFAIGETSPNPGGLPYRFLIKSAISVGFSLLLLQAFSVVAQSLLTIRND